MGGRSSGRLVVARHLINNMPFMVATCYGFSAGPTWPDNKRLTSQLLATLSQDLVVGGTGPRIITGGFNCTCQQLEEFKLWESYGWVEAQQHAHQCWQQPIVPTCEGSTVVDILWMSPEAARMCRNAGHISTFPDHVTLFGDFEIPEKVTNILTWPKPTSIPWSQIDKEKWNNDLITSTAPDDVSSCSTQFFAEWAQHWEEALDGCVQDQLAGHLPNTFKRPGKAHSADEGFFGITCLQAFSTRRSATAIRFGVHPSSAMVQAIAKDSELQACGHCRQANSGC